MAEPCAVIGIGQTKHSRRARDVSIAGLVREAAQRALDDAGLDWTDIDSVVLGKAPDTFEGVMMPELYLADALGAAGKPMMRVHTAGSVGGSTAVVASHLVQSGDPRARARSRVREAVRGQRAVGPRRWSQRRHGRGRDLRPVDRSVHPALGRARAHRLDGRGQGPPERGEEPVRAPEARRHHASRRCKESPMLWEPIRFLESCPSSDGACAIVLADEAGPRRRPRRRRGCTATSVRSRARLRSPGATRCARRPASTARPTSTGRPASRTRASRSTSPRSTCRSAGTSRCGSRATTSPARARAGRWSTPAPPRSTATFPVNPSGGVLSSNPIGASGMLRFAEAAMQVRGTAGEHQVDGAKLALGHAYGGAAQYFAMWVVSSEPAAA